ncbi:acyl-CoA sterol acyl transferase 1 [Prunus dulcis]|uniref:Acyl-CoA sterol acyl transferase 1 n=1 Tax=Prunus dulcis TaxID=3755 RepID=A0A4Y1R9P6_PRUDU|nr:acyl-CoA sterol acyl transferase 1 [Prunus dulcis]
MEHYGHHHPAPHRVRTRRCAFDTGGRAQVGPAPCRDGTFIVSAIMHELIFYYLGRLPPTWEISWFFLLHGLCLVVEIAVKKAIAKRKKFQVPRLVSGPLTVAFVTGTVFWLFFPPLLRCNADVRALGSTRLLARFSRMSVVLLHLEP